MLHYKVPDEGLDFSGQIQLSFKGRTLWWDNGFRPTYRSVFVLRVLLSQSSCPKRAITGNKSSDRPL